MLQLLVHVDAVARVRQPLVVASRHGRGDVAEGLQPLRGFRVHVARARELGGIALERSLHGLRDAGVGEGGVGLLPRVPGDVVELRLRPVDVVTPRVHQRAQRAPAEVDARVVRLAVDALGRPPCPGPRSRSDAPLRTLAPELQEGRDRRHDVGQRDGRREPGPGLARARQLQQERDVEDLAIEQDPVLLLPVVSEPLPVVGDEKDDGAIVEPLALQAVDELADDGVRRRDLGVVGRPVAGAEGLGRLVGEVRLEEVHEQEERLRLHALDPGQGAPRGLAAGPLQEAHVAASIPRRRRRSRRRRPRSRRCRSRRAARSSRPRPRWRSPCFRRIRASVGCAAPSKR